MNFNELLALLFIGLIIAFCIWLYRRLRKPDITKLYNAKTVLTDREYEFYKRLKPLADEYGLSVLAAEVRLDRIHVAGDDRRGKLLLPVERPVDGELRFAAAVVTGKDRDSFQRLRNGGSPLCAVF